MTCPEEDVVCVDCVVPPPGTAIEGAFEEEISPTGAPPPPPLLLLPPLLELLLPLLVSVQTVEDGVTVTVTAAFAEIEMLDALPLQTIVA